MFIQSFSQSFINVVKSLSPDIKFDPTNQTPQWNAWSSGEAEMYFGMTAADLPDIRGIGTDTGLLGRCALVSSSSFALRTLTLNFTQFLE